MGFKCGIVGLPNVGKSTFFNAITATASATADNYPFCTIEPNKALIAVGDERLKKIAKIVDTKTIIPAYIELIDIAGLIQGANKGEGLGNKFLEHIREVDVIIHLLRCFEDSNVMHVNNRIDPIADLEIVRLELILADLQTVEKMLANLEKKSRSKKENKELIPLLIEIKSVLENGHPVSSIENFDKKQSQIKLFNLLTSKEFFYVCNTSENDILSGNKFTAEVVEFAKKQNTKLVILSAQIEFELALLDDLKAKEEFCSALGIKESGLNKVTKVGYDLLGLQSYFTAGKKEVRAWTIGKDSLAPEAAGVIHTDFQKGFIRVEVISYDDYIEFNGRNEAKAQGKMKLCGKDYIVQNGDILHFLFNV